MLTPQPLADADLRTGIIVEIGGSALFAGVDASAKFIWTSEETPALPTQLQFNLREFWRLLRDALGGRIDMIVVHPPTRHPPWHWRPLRSIIHRPFAPWRRFIRLFGIQALRLLPKRVPIYVIDGDDMRTIPSCHAFLLDRCIYYFKRELPIDRWQVFQRTAHSEMPSSRFRGIARNRRRIDKLRPWSIGLATPTPGLPALDFPDKSIDLFVSVANTSSTVRDAGLSELRALASRRGGIVIADKRLPHDEFLRMMARAWLTWSPEGFGWDCIRHYEAAAAFSVPVINQPTIVRYQPLLDRVHALYYDADVPGALTTVIESALADLDRLRRIATAARQHVATHHLTPWHRAEQLRRYHAGLEDPPGELTIREPTEPMAPP